MDNKLAVIILNLNGCAVTADCLASLRASRFTGFFTIVVDNGSTDDSVETFRRDYPEVEVIATGANLGFTGGNNVGMARALERGCESLLLLNNDTILHEDCLGTMAAALSSDASIGAVTPKVLFHDHPDRIWSAGGDISLWRGVARHHGLRALASDPRFAAATDCTFVTGCALCVKREVVEKIGLLDNDLFIYNEDTDYSIRIARAGYRMRYVPEGILWHREGYDSRRASGQRRRIHLVTRNILRVHAKHRKWYHLLTFVPWFAFRWLGLSGGYALVRRDTETVGGIVSGVRAYFRHETGPVAKS